MQFFPGAYAPGSQQPMALCRNLAGRGHDVCVISTNYNLDTGQTEQAGVVRDRNGGTIRLNRLPSPRGGRGNSRQRLWSYLSFMITAAAEGRKYERPDIILGSIQPLFTGWAAMHVARMSRVPFVLEVRDLWPDALVVKGAVGKRMAGPLFWMAETLYRRADRIVSLTPGIKKELVKKGIASNKIDVFPNGFDGTLVEGAERNREQIRKRYGWGNHLVAIYTGSFTKVTAMDTVVRAASVLKEQLDLRFDLFGRGPTLNEIKSLARALGATNVTFHDPVPKVEIPGLLAASDVAIMCLFKSPLVHIYFENKFMDYLGAGKPILAAMEGEQAEIIKKYSVGRVAPTFDYYGLATLIQEAAREREAFAEMGKRGSRLVRDKLFLPTILEKYAQMLEHTATGKAKELTAWEPSL